jgi:membrane complex biogenesis BtpA family protein
MDKRLAVAAVGRGVDSLAAMFSRKPIFGMIHMPALPTAPKNAMTIDQLIDFALAEARELERAGLDAAIVENVGDAPFFRDAVPPATVAAMALLTREVKRATTMKVGVNMLRNAWEAALSVAYIAGADFIRCNVVIGAYVTDQGIIQGCAAELARLRESLDRRVLVFGDIHVKHAHPLYDVPIEDAAKDLAERGGVDAVIVSGRRSPDPPTLATVRLVANSVKLPVLVGSGVGLHNVADFYRLSGGVLLGETDFKIGRQWGGASDERTYAQAVAACRAREQRKGLRGRAPLRGQREEPG